MKVFDGKKFLESRQVKIALSNGAVATVQEIEQKYLDAFSKIGEEAEFKDVKELAAKIMALPIEKLDGIGIVELRGAIDFLFESLFGSK